MKKENFFLILFCGLCFNLYSEEMFFEGVTEPYQYATISSIVAGRITLINKNEGGYCKKGQQILELESTEEKLRVERSKLIADSKAGLNSAKQRAETAKLDYDATLSLYEQTGSISEEELWQKKLEYELTKSELDKVIMIEAKEQLEHQIESAILEKHRIRAPFSGEVIKINRQLGESCEAQEPLVYIANIKKCRFVTYIDPELGTLFGIGDSVNLSFGNFDDASISKRGVIEYISRVVDPASGLQRIKIVVDNKDLTIKPGVAGVLKHKVL